jgi:hypothetical protein
MNREQLRRAMPTVAAIVDEFRPFMANGGKLIYASENGHVIDRREPVDEDKVFTVPPNYRKPVGGWKK